MEAVVGAETPTVVTANVADVAPDAIVTVAGTIALAVLELRLIVTPSAGAAVLMVTVPVEPLPPSTESGEIERLVSAIGGVIVNVADFELVPDVAVITASTFAATLTVVIAKNPVVDPAGIVNDEGTVAST